HHTAKYEQQGRSGDHCFGAECAVRASACPSSKSAGNVGKYSKEADLHDCPVQDASGVDAPERVERVQGIAIEHRGDEEAEIGALRGQVPERLAQLAQRLADGSGYVFARLV